MSKFFIHRPIFAWVIAILIFFAGVLVFPNVAVEQYPDVAPPQINISASYPGASAEDVARSVTSLIEEELNGAEGLLYYSSSSTSDGRSDITATFVPGTNDDLAQVDVQNRVSSVMSSLPQAVLQQGVRYHKGNSNFLLLVALTSTDGRYTPADLSDYINRNIKTSISRVKGVGNFQLFGGERTMRIWADPDRLTSFNMTMEDVISALSVQNIQISTGILGTPPTTTGQATTSIVSVNGQLSSVQEFENIVVRANADGSLVHLKDVAKVEIGQQSYQFNSRVNGKDSSLFAISLLPGANALETQKAVLAEMQVLSQYFPEGIEYSVPYDTAPYVEQSITQVMHTLLEAVVLVFIVMFIFLQNIRYTIIPALVVPVVIMGTLAILHFLGFSINTLTMFAMILAIGILVDDAIVVVENVERLMTEENLSPLEATLKGMPQISGAIIGITVVLMTVFTPLILMSGSSGVIYRQFAAAMMVSIAFSSFLALSFTPALCATILKPVKNGHHEKKGFFGWFNRNFGKLTSNYMSWVQVLLKKAGRMMVIYLCLGIGMMYVLIKLPGSFLPEEDQGYTITNIELPSGASASRTDEVIQKVEDYYLKQDETKGIVTVRGFNFNGTGLNVGIAFSMFKDFSERKGAEHSAFSIAGKATGALLFGTPDATIFSIVPPSIPSLGNASGFDLRLQDRGSVGIDGLREAAQKLVALANQSPILTNVWIVGIGPGPAIKVEIDRTQASIQGVSMSNISTVLSSALGGAYINKFPNMGRMQQVWLQADRVHRMQPEDILKLKVKNSRGELVEMSSFAKISWSNEQNLVDRYNGYYAVSINGSARAGYANGEAISEMERLIRENMPTGIGYEWTGLTYQEIEAGNQAPMMMALSVVVVFLVLAALYESWTIPLAAILIVPLGLLGVVLAAYLTGKSNDLYFQVGMITVIGLATKNAILIVEFAKDAVATGKPLIESTLEAARLRLRPILMTSFAFILGVTPLLFASAAGAAGQKAVGTGVVGGMLVATFCSVIFVPIFFVVVLKLFKSKPKLLGSQAATHQEKMDKQQKEADIYNDSVDFLKPRDKD